MTRFALRGLGSFPVTWAFIAAAVVLSVGSAVAAIACFASDDPGTFAHGTLLLAVSIFTGWMATAIHQFQQRLSAIDEVVRQGRRRMDQSDQALKEMRQLARQIRSSSQVDENEEDRTIH